jgi:hypothetical protein
MSTIAAGTTSGTALVSTGNTDGTLQLQVNGTTPSVTLAANGAIGVGSSPSYGSSGQVLTSAGTGSAPSWVTASAGALTFISSVTASSSATVSFTNIGATYGTYMITFTRVIPATNNVRLRVRTSTNNGSSYDSGATDYRYAYFDAKSNNTTSGFGDTTSYIELQGSSLSNDVNVNGLNGFFYLYGPSTAGYVQNSWNTSHVNTSTDVVMTVGAGGTMLISDVDAIQFFMGSGNIASGTFRLYGIANS